MERKPRKKSATKPRRAKSGRRSLRIALIGSLLIGGAHLAVSFASAAGTEDLAVLARTHRRLITTPTNAALQGRPETTSAAVLPGLPGVPQTNFGRASASQRVHSEAATPPLDAFRGDTAVPIQPAPEAVVIAAPLPERSDSLSRKMVDSSGGRTLKRILRTIGGAAPTEPTRKKR
jgi:hypothetical protein